MKWLYCIGVVTVLFLFVKTLSLYKQAQIRSILLSHNISTVDGRKYIVLYVDYNCEICKEELSQLKHIEQKFNKMYVITAGSIDSLRFYLQGLSLQHCEIVNDSLLDMATEMEIRVIPTTYIIENKNVKKFLGACDLSAL